MFSFSGAGTGAFLISEADALVPLLLLVPAAVCCLPWKEKIEARWGTTNGYRYGRYILALAVWLLSVAMLLGETYNPFIYFRF